MSSDLYPIKMEAPYVHQGQPPPQAQYHMTAAGSRNENVPPPQYHNPGVSQQHMGNGQPYAYNPNIMHPPTQAPPMQNPLQAGQVGENGNVKTEAPPSHSMIELGRKYTLEVVQQPQRARMCGFGDKDRRPITPPPCIRLIVTDAVTGAEIDMNDIEHGLYVLNVDLWSADGKQEINLVRHSTNSPAISSTIPTSYAQSQAAEGTPIYSNPLPVPNGPPSITRDPQYPYHNTAASSNPQGATPYNPYPQQPSVTPYGQQSQQITPQGQYAQVPQQQYQQGGYQQPQRPGSPVYQQARTFPDPPNHHVYYHTGSTVHAIASNAPRPVENLMFNPNDPNMQRSPTNSASGGMYTRNLIGSLSASAFSLTDPNNKIGIWFVLQDLSVRTEGVFRLRFSFCNVGAPTKTPNGNPANQISIVNTGKAPILASCFSNEFQVFSAKKFPGVVESTPLSKCFATQGIKIPIRKDGPGKAGKDGDEEEG